MATALLELLQESDLIKFFAIVGSSFFFIGLLGSVWGIKEPLSKWSRITLLTVGALMLVSAGIGFSEQKQQIISSHYRADSKNEAAPSQAVAQQDDNSNEQKIDGNNNNTLGNIKGSNNKVVQGDNNDIDSNNPVTTTKTYYEGDKIVHLTINEETGEVLKRRVEKIETAENEPPVLKPKVQSNSCSLNNKTYDLMDSSGEYIKFYEQEGNKLKFIAKILIYDIHGTATQSGDKVYLNGNFGKGEVSLSNGCKYLNGHIKGKVSIHHFNSQLR